MHPRGHELVHIRSMNWVQSTFITCHAFLFFARTSLDNLGHMTVSSTTLHRDDIFSQLSPILRSAGTSVYSSGQVFVQAGSGVDFFCLEFF